MIIVHVSLNVGLWEKGIRFILHPDPCAGESDNYSVESQGVLHPKTSPMTVNGTS